MLTNRNGFTFRIFILFNSKSSFLLIAASEYICMFLAPIIDRRYAVSFVFAITRTAFFEHIRTNTSFSPIHRAVIRKSS